MKGQEKSINLLTAEKGIESRCKIQHNRTAGVRARWCLMAHVDHLKTADSWTLASRKSKQLHACCVMLVVVILTSVAYRCVYVITVPRAAALCDPCLEGLGEQRLQSVVTRYGGSSISTTTSAFEKTIFHCLPLWSKLISESSYYQHVLESMSVLRHTYLPRRSQLWRITHILLDNNKTRTDVINVYAYMQESGLKLLSVYSWSFCQYWKCC